MPPDGRLASFVARTARRAGRRYAEAVYAYAEGRSESDDAARADAANPAEPDAVAYPDLPRDDGRTRIVCRRYVERRAVAFDSLARPACFDADHPACEGCLEDLRAGRIETW